jgi:hypothetical protein
MADSAVGLQVNNSDISEDGSDWAAEQNKERQDDYEEQG